jgi:predicted acetyltransferase
MRPEDDPLPLRLTDPLRARALPLSPLYTRLLDVVRCLEARAASADGRVVLGLADPFGDQTGTLSIESEGGRLACRWTESPPQLSMTTDVLAALWLGGYRAARLRDARRIVEHDPGSVGRLDSMLVTERRPWTPFEF